MEISPALTRSGYAGSSSHKINSFSHPMGEGGRRPDESCPENKYLLGEVREKGRRQKGN